MSSDRTCATSAGGAGEPDDGSSKFQTNEYETNDYQSSDRSIPGRHEYVEPRAEQVQKRTVVREETRPVYTQGDDNNHTRSMLPLGPSGRTEFAGDPSGPAC